MRDEEPRLITLDGRRMQTRETAHDELQAALSLPGYYGRNLDALHDCLTDIGRPTQITLVNASAMLQGAQGYGARLAAVLLQSAAENPRLTVTIHSA